MFQDFLSNLLQTEYGSRLNQNMQDIASDSFVNDMALQNQGAIEAPSLQALANQSNGPTSESLLNAPVQSFPAQEMTTNAMFENAPAMQQLAQSQNYNPFDNISLLEKIGIGLGGVDAVDKFKNSALQQREAELQKQRQSALQQLSQGMQSGQLNQNQARQEYANITGDYSGMFEAPQQQELTQFEKSRQTTLGKAAGEAEATKPKAISGAKTMLDTIDLALSDPSGLQASTGGVGGLLGRQSSVFPITSNQRRFDAVADQLEGQIFLDAYQDLKGGGQITEVEGRKAQQAQARLNRAQNTDDYINALKDLRQVAINNLKKLDPQAAEQYPEITNLGSFQ